ncbi:zinc-binding dehydrogenase [Streptomyces tendae]|uniref:zinc-binding dehydrogenase n=1 Tax=Streptomyces tendae TaxID=1932 RepID=UPI003720DC26
MRAVQAVGYGDRPLDSVRLAEVPVPEVCGPHDVVVRIGGAGVVVDFVGEGGATRDGVRMRRRAGDYHVVGYGENIDVPTIDVISSEINFIGNLVGSYLDLCELMVLAAEGRVRLHTATYPLDRFRDTPADLDAGRVRGRAVLVP